MSDWEEASLADLADYINGRAIKPEECSSSDGIPVIRIKQINNPESIEDRFCGEDLDEKNIARRGDLLFSWSATLKTILWQGPTGAINQHIFKVLPKEGIDKTFLHCLIDHAIPALAEESHGSTMKHIKKSALSAFHLQIPPLPEQKKIAEILSGIDKATALLEAKISKLNFAKSSVCQREFSHATYLQAEEDVNENTPQKKILREVADVIDCKHRTPVYASEGYPVVRPRDVKESGINFDQCMKTSADELDSLNQGIDPQVNDIVYSRNATLGVGALVKDKTTFAIGQDVCILRSKTINSKYLYYQLNSSPFLRQVENLVSGSTFKRINLGAIRELQVITPGTSEQARVASTLEYIDNLIASLKRRREKYTQIKTSLAQDLLSGRKRVSI